MIGSSFRGRIVRGDVFSLALAAGVACALSVAARPASAEPRRERSESRSRGYSEHQVHRRDRCDTPRRDPYGWYSTPSRSIDRCNTAPTTVVLAGGFGPTVLYDRWGRRCDSAYYGYGPSPLYIYRYGTYGRYTRYWDSPSYRYRLVDVDPEIAATQRRVGAVDDGVTDSQFHAWQLAQRESARAANQSASVAAATPVFVPGPASVSTSPTAVSKGVVPAGGGEAVKPDPPRSEPLSNEEAASAWKALEDGRYLEAQALFSRGADAPAMPGGVDQRAALSAGFAVSAVMLNREEAAAWALRRAVDLDAGFAAKVPWTDGLKQRVREAAGRMESLHSVQPTSDRAVLVKHLGVMGR